MLCDICQKRRAKIYYTEIMNGEKKEQHLCEECAATHTTFTIKNPITNQEFAIGNLLSGILSTYYGNGNTDKAENVKEQICEKCGMSSEEFMKKGKFGCSECYTSFRNIIQRKIKAIQGADQHTGKVPKRLSTIKKLSIDTEPEEITTEKVVKPKRRTQKQKPISEIDKLSMQLQQAIEVEEYEEAARLRDLIRELKTKGNEVKQ